LFFVEAIKAQLPLITVSTRDMMNFADIVRFMTGKVPKAYKPDGKIVPGDLLYFHEKALQHPHKEYDKMLKSEATLLVVNPVKPITEAFSVGELFVPIDKVKADLMEAYGKNDDGQPDPAGVAFVNSILPTLGGLTLKEVGEIIRLTEVRDDGVSPQGITRTRALLVPDLQGFSAVMTTMDGPYLPNDELALFAAENKALFLGTAKIDDPRLIPKGLLLDGDTGTGKTQGTKWLANQWGVPLYRLDPSILNKYYGESESNLQTIFAKVAQEAPCILLVDEIEKLFGRNKGGEVDSMTSRLLGLLLWFMQESRDRVFIVMTSNRKDLLPEELYREGRIDGTITFRGLDEMSAVNFTETVLQSYMKDVPTDLEAKMHDAVAAMYAGKDRVSHAALTEAVKAVVKAAIVEAGE
jgi:hypothetical protein